MERSQWGGGRDICNTLTIKYSFENLPGVHDISMTITDDINLDLLIKVGITGFATVNSVFPFPFSYYLEASH